MHYIIVPVKQYKIVLVKQYKIVRIVRQYKIVPVNQQIILPVQQNITVPAQWNKIPPPCTVPLKTIVPVVANEFSRRIGHQEVWRPWIHRKYFTKTDFVRFNIVQSSKHQVLKNKSITNNWWKKTHAGNGSKKRNAMKITYLHLHILNVRYFPSFFLKFIKNSWRENRRNHYREGGLNMWS